MYKERALAIADKHKDRFRLDTRRSFNVYVFTQDWSFTPLEAIEMSITKWVLFAQGKPNNPLLTVGASFNCALCMHMKQVYTYMSCSKCPVTELFPRCAAFSGPYADFCNTSPNSLQRVEAAWGVVEALMQLYVHNGGSLE